MTESQINLLMMLLFFFGIGFLGISSIVKSSQVANKELDKSEYDNHIRIMETEILNLMQETKDLRNRVTCLERIVLRD